jgi:hypothetical protein
LRVKGVGWRLVYTPAAIVDHVAGPYAKGSRFDLRYVYFGGRNHVVLLGGVVGARSPQFRRNYGVAVRNATFDLAEGLRAARDVKERGARSSGRTMAGGILRASANLSGVIVGTAVVARQRLSYRREA